MTPATSCCATVATRLAEAVRAADTVARLGGDEFVVLCEDIGDESEVGRRRRAASHWRSSEPFVLEGAEHFIRRQRRRRCSPRPSRHRDGLVRDADAAMYRAKERGRGRYELFDDDDALPRRGAPRDREPTCAAPSSATSSRSSTSPLHARRPRARRDRGAGALEPPRARPAPAGRLHRRRRGQRADRRARRVVLREACLQLAAWRRAVQVPGSLGVSVNVSARQLCSPASSKSCAPPSRTPASTASRTS